MRTLAIALLLLGCCALPLSADDEPQDDTPYLEGDKQICKQPPMLLKRPSDSWQFVDLEKMKKKAEAEGQDVSTPAWRQLKFRLYSGSQRANIFVYARIDDEERDEPLTAEALAEGKLASLRGAFKEPTVGKPKKVRVGRTVGVMLQIEGALLQGGKEHAVLAATGFRSQDKCVLEVQLECKPSQVKKLSKELKTLLKKLKF